MTSYRMLWLADSKMASYRLKLHPEPHPKASKNLFDGTFSKASSPFTDLESIVFISPTSPSLVLFLEDLFLNVFFFLTSFCTSFSSLVLTLGSLLALNLTNFPFSAFDFLPFVFVLLASTFLARTMDVFALFSCFLLPMFLFEPLPVTFHNTLLLFFFVAWLVNLDLQVFFFCSDRWLVFLGILRIVLVEGFVSCSLPIASPGGLDLSWNNIRE